MTESPIRMAMYVGRFALCLEILLSPYSSTFVQAKQKPAAADSRMDTPSRIQVRGCLGRVLDEYHFAPEPPGPWLVLTGHTAGLEKYIDRELTLEGSKGDSIRSEGYFDPVPSFEVTRIVKVFEKAGPVLSPAFTTRANWHAETNEKYGVKFARPLSMIAAEGPGPTLQPNFITNQDAEIVSSFGIPGTAYPNANLFGGSFTIFVNRGLKTRASCMQFGQLGPRDEAPSPYVASQLQYVKTETGSAAMGTWYSEYYFHTFQSGHCYEVAFELIEFNAHNADAGCNVPLLSDQDNLNLIKPLIESVSFFLREPRHSR